MVHWSTGHSWGFQVVGFTGGIFRSVVGLAVHHSALLELWGSCKLLRQIIDASSCQSSAREVYARFVISKDREDRKTLIRITDISSQGQIHEKIFLDKVDDKVSLRRK